jgi:hypothetical protein
MGKTTNKGTCGACFRSMTLGADGKVVRHGWREAGGTRRVGSYGHVFHSGACFGVGWLPYEVSSDCTTAFVEQVLFPMGVNAQGYLTHLATRPALVYEGATWAANFTEVRNAPGCRGHRGGSDYWDGYYRWSLKLRDGDPAVTLKNHPENWGGDKVPSYDTYLASKVSDGQRTWEGIAKDALYCLSMVSSWKPVAVKTVEKKLPLLHTGHTNSPWLARCRMTFGRGPSLRVTQVAADVTCPKCLAIMAREAERAAKKSA